MVLLNDYISVFSAENDDLKNLRRFGTLISKFVRFGRLYFQLYFLRKKHLKKTNQRSVSCLLQAKGFLATLESQKDSLKDQDLGKPIAELEEIISDFAELRDDTVNGFRKIRPAKLSQLDFALSNFDQTIETFYATLRLLKRLNKKQSIETSDLATGLSRHSLQSLMKLKHGH
jgi:hypothetical protein